MARHDANADSRGPRSVNESLRLHLVTHRSSQHRDVFEVASMTFALENVSGYRLIFRRTPLRCATGFPHVRDPIMTI